MRAARNYREKMHIVGTRNHRASAQECHLITVIFCRAFNCRGKSSVQTEEQLGRKVFGCISSMSHRVSTLQDIHPYSPSLEHSLYVLWYHDERMWECVCISSPASILWISFDAKQYNLLTGNHPHKFFKLVSSGCSYNSHLQMAFTEASELPNVASKAQGRQEP